MRTQNDAEVSSTAIEAELNSLSQLQSNVIKAKCSPQMWPEYFLSHPVIEKFLIWVTEVIKKQRSAELKSWIKQVVNPIDLTLMKSDEKHVIIQEIFCDKEFDLEIIPLSSENIYQYFHIIKDVFSLLRTGNPKSLLNNQSNAPSFTYIEELTKYYKTHMEKSKQKHDILLLDTLLITLGYNAEKSTFEAVYEEDFLYFSTNLDQKHVQEYFETSVEDTLRRESFIVRLGITLALNHPRKCEMLGRINLHITYIKKQLGEEFSSELSNVLEKYCTSEGYEVEKILESLLPSAIDTEEAHTAEHSSLSAIVQHTSATAAVPTGQESNNLQNMLKYFNIIESYPQKLTFRDALVIRHEIPISKIEPTDLPLVTVNKIMACDKKCRSILIPCKIPKNEYYVCESEESEDSESSDSEPESNNEFYIIHPLDIIMISLHCSDNFLRHELFSKLFSCQIAVPLLLPDTIKKSLTLLLWALRSVKKSWKAVDSHGKVHSKSCSVVDHEGAIVSFLKCGTHLSKSKSKLLNDVIGSEDIFFHWDMLKEHNCHKIVSQGVVELCCYYPGKKDPIFKDAMIFTNLHGDAVQHPKQVAFIQAISFISCVLITKKGLSKKQNTDILNALAKSAGGIIVLLVDSKSYKEDKLKQIIDCGTVSVICLKGKASAAIESEIRRLISSRVESYSHKFLSISNCVDIARENDIEIDEDDEACVLGRKAALEMKQIIDGVEFIKIKDHFLPLQGSEMWQKWAAHEKEHHRHKERRNQSPMEYKVLKEREKDETKFHQLQCMNHLNFSPLIKAFLQNLLQCKGNCKSYFLQWLRMFLDSSSKDTLLELQISYQNTRSEIEKVSTTDTGRIKELKELSKHQNNMLINASVGIEHFFREVGQIYEIAVFKDTHQPSVDLTNFESDEIKYLPMVAAKALVEGFAMEIMDGEASHIPLTWVRAVIRCLRQMYTGKTLFVLSILGIQSSGKSTLLNTMFGLRFNVSVARCTRGAFIQLLVLDEELKKELHCDFILIVDTEGICAPELLIEGSEQHDNELATFVIGLADFTIINIYGETPANLSDILQTVLHAFIRMKEVDKNPGCLFVHQNVTEQFATDSLQPGKQILLDQLNRLTRAVAKIEHCEESYQKFQDVIKFDINEDVYYFSSLWKGDPPMAPINVGYSECAQELKQAVLRLIKGHQKLCTFESFENRIENLWTAILKENFIFSFKNTMEVAAYSELDLQYGEWSWKLQEVSEKQLLLCENKIKSCSTQDTIEVIKKACVNDSIKVLNTKCDELCNELTAFIEKHDFANIMSKWDFDYKDRLKEKKEVYVTTVKQHCERLVRKKENEQQKVELQQQYVEQLRDEVTKLVAELGSYKTADKVDIKKKFDTNWEKWIAEFREKITYLEYTSDPEIIRYIESSLGDYLVSEYQLLIKKIEKHPLTESAEIALHMEVDIKVHINIKRKPTTKFTYRFLWMKFRDTDPVNKICTIAQKETNRVLSNVKNQIKVMMATKQEGFTPSLPDTLLKELFDAIANFNDSSEEFSFTSEYKVDMALIVCRYAAYQFQCWTSNLRKENDPILALQQQRSKFFTIFFNKYSKVAAETAAASEFCSSLTDSIINAVISKLYVSLVSYLKATNGNFNSKPGFKVQILTDLAKYENFKAYKQFLTNSNVSYKQWATCYVKSLRESKNSPFKELVIQELNQLLFTVTEAVQRTDLPNSTKWLNNFCTAVDGIIEVKQHDWIKDIKDVSNNQDSMNHFKTNLIKELNSTDCHEHMLKEINKQSRAICEAAGSLLYDSVINKTCTAQCPFCCEQCDIINSGHLHQKEPKLHYVQVHRPQCVGRVKWYRTKKLVLDVCSSLVDSKNYLVLLKKDPTGKTEIPYKDYQQEYPEWNIPGETIADPPMYWMWFVSHFYKDLVTWSGAVETEIPQSWKAISKSKAIDSLAQTYGVYYSKQTTTLQPLRKRTHTQK